LVNQPGVVRFQLKWVPEEGSDIEADDPIVKHYEGKEIVVVKPPPPVYPQYPYPAGHGPHPGGWPNPGKWPQPAYGGPVVGGPGPGPGPNPGKNYGGKGGGKQG
jgi:hypothetical protein